MKKRKKINIILPFYQMKRGDRMHISLSSIAICLSEKGGVGLLYINRNPIISPMQLTGFVPIIKIGDEFEGRDFEIEFSSSSFYAIYDKPLTKEKWLNPVEIPLNFITPFNVSDLLDYSEFSLQELIDHFEDQIEGVNIDFYENNILKIFVYLPGIAKTEYSLYDIEMLYTTKSYIDNIIADLDDSRRGMLAQKFYQEIKRILVETIAIKKEEEREYDLDLSIEDIRLELQYLSMNGGESSVRTDELLTLLQIKKNKNKRKKKGGG